VFELHPNLLAYHVVQKRTIWYMSAKDDLLAAAMAHVTEHGVGELSLRTLAAAIGTSHRMLIYHFGSRDGLLVEIVRAVEQRQRDLLSALLADPDLAPEELAERFWAHLTDPAMWPSERLFFELYGQALQGRPHAARLLDGVVTDWLDPLAELAVRSGVPRERARAHARLQLAVARGLLLDLLATGDVAGVRAAAEVQLAAYPGPAVRGR
jgi:AcrR family transcriptional regulator